MLSITLVVVLFFFSIKCDNMNQAKKNFEKNKLIGIETSHEKSQNNPQKIDKDTIITKNLKLTQKRNLNKNSIEPQPTKEEEPDWSYASFPPEVAVHVAEFKLNMSQCLKEVQRNDRHSLKHLSPRKESPVHGECLIACVLKRNGVIEMGKVNKANLIALVNKFYGKNVKMMKKLEKNLDRCIESSAHSHDDCILAAKLNECTNGLMASNKHKLTLNY